MSGNKEIIKKLENIRDLIKEYYSLNQYIEEGNEEEFSQAVEKIKNDLGEIEVPSVFGNMPVFPIDELYFASTKNDKESKEKIFKIILIATIISLVLYFITHWGFLNTVSVIGVFATAIFGYFYSTSKRQYNTKKGEYDKTVEKYKKTNDAFLQSLEFFEDEKKDCIANSKEYAERYESAYGDFVMALADNGANMSKATERLSELEEKLSNNEIIDPQYFYLIDEIISNLRTGRADDYKEAVNLAIEEEKERQEMIARREAEERQNRILAMQVEEQRRHNEAIERQNRENAERMQALERDRIRMEQRAAQTAQNEVRLAQERTKRDAQQQANATRMAGVSKCASCANSRHCPTHIKNNGSGLTCGGYTPYK